MPYNDSGRNLVRTVLALLSADAATAIKRGDDVATTRAITKMEKLAKTNPNAGTRTTILQDATKATTIGEQMETLGKMQSDTSGKTTLRDSEDHDD